MATTIAEPPHLAADLKTLCLSTTGGYVLVNPGRVPCVSGQHPQQLVPSSTGRER